MNKRYFQLKGNTMDAKYNQHFDEYLNEECLKDNYSIPTEEELLALQNGKADNILTGKKLSYIFESLYRESDYLMQLDYADFEKAGYKLIDVSKEFKDKERVYRVLFSDGSNLDFYHL
jgi:hypothetical protein